MLRLETTSGVLECAAEEDHRSYLRWHVNQGRTFGIAANTPEIREFLQKVLGRMEKESRVKHEGTYELVVETSEQSTEHPYLVTLSDRQRDVIVADRAATLEVCMTAVTGRLNF